MQYRIVLINVLIVLGLSACASSLYHRAQTYEKLGDYDSAIDAYTRLVETTQGPQQALAYAALGHLYTQLGDYWEAIDFLKQAQKILDEQKIPKENPEYGKFCYDMGYCYYEIVNQGGEQWAHEAITYLKQAVDMVPRAHLYLSVLYYKQKQYGDSLKHAALVTGTDEAYAKYISGLAYHGLKKCSEAITALTKAVELERNRDTRRDYQKVLAEVGKACEAKVPPPENQFWPIFSARRAYYAKHPIGQAVVRNPTAETLQNATLSLEMPDFIDHPEVYSLGDIPPNKDTLVPFTVHFNDQKMQQVNENRTEVSVTLRLQYTSNDGTQKLITAPVQYVDIYSVNKTDLKPEESIAAFVTHENETVVGFTHHAVSANTSLEKAIQVYEAMNLSGIQYERDPKDPYGKDIDKIFYPWETLKNKKEDCDGLSVLYAACLESIGIDTELVVTPDHVFVRFNAGILEEQARRVIPDANLYRIRDGMAWIPVEVTLLGKENFFGAWRTGADKYNTSTLIKHVNIREAWSNFPPALKGPSLDVTLPNKDDILKAYNDDIELTKKYFSGKFDQNIASYQKDPGIGEANAQNWIGIERALKGSLEALKDAKNAWLDWDEAEKAFKGAKNLYPSVTAYHNNLANVYFLKGDLKGAKDEYEAALNPPLSGEVMNPVAVHLNMAILYYAQRQAEDAKRELQECEKLCMEEKKYYAQFVALARALGFSSSPSPSLAEVTTKGEQIQTKIEQVVRDHQTGTRANQITNPGELGWWLHWMR